MHVVVVGATGNVGTSLLGALSADPEIESVLGLARRRAALPLAKTTWAAANVETDDLRVHFRGADVVVHLAWRIQPSRNLAALRRTNVEGSARVFCAAAEAGVQALVYASSVGVYSPGPRDERVDESWPREGIRTSFYSRHKAEVERLLDQFEIEHPRIRVVRLRPALIFKREAASGNAVTATISEAMTAMEMVSARSANNWLTASCMNTMGRNTIPAGRTKSVGVAPHVTDAPRPAATSCSSSWNVSACPAMRAGRPSRKSSRPQNRSHVRSVPFIAITGSSRISATDTSTRAANAC